MDLIIYKISDVCLRTQCFYHRWRGKLWSSLVCPDLCCTGRCSSPRPGWRRAGWWAGCRTARRWARPSRGTPAQSWGRCALQRRPRLWTLLEQECISTRPAAPSQANRRSRRGTPSYRSPPSCCPRRWLVLGVKRRATVQWWVGGGNRETEGEEQDNVNLQKYEAPKHKTVSGICSSCFWLVRPPSPCAPALY